MKRKLLVVTNPSSGGSRKNQKILRELTAFLITNEFGTVVRATEMEQNARRIIENELDNSFSDLVIVGGDGTINETVNGLQLDIPMTIIPAGTGNDFVKNISLGKTLQEQFEVLLKDNIRPIDLSKCNGRRFTNGVGIGFDGQIVEPGFVIRNRNEDIKHNKTGTYVERHSTAMVIRQVYVKCLF